MPRPERPVDPGEGDVQEFAVALRVLREQAGGPTYRSLADRTGFSVSTLADAAGGRRLPTLAVAVAYAVACGGDEHEWAARWRTVAAGRAPAERAPYRGMAGFRGEDADLFFGREGVVAELVARVRESPLTMVLGASGAGKSSLLAAGLVPALTDLRPVITTPSGRLPRLTRKTVLVVDQFEELYTLCTAGERTRFLARLDEVLAGTRVVVSVRADYYARCAEHPRLADALCANQLLVGPMSEDGLREAVTRPAAAVGLSVERALVAKAVQEAKGRAGVLPLLSHAMLETWRRRRGTVLTLAGFEAAGGIDGAVVRTAEETYGALDPARRELAAELLLRMLSIDELATRRRADLADVLSVDPDAATVIDRLADARLVTVDDGTVEIAHDAMLAAWPRLRSWIDDHRDAVRAHRKISEAARIWVESERDPSALASGSRLTVMNAHSSTLAGVLRLNQVEKDFLRESESQATLARTTARRRAWRQRGLVAAAVGAVVAAMVFAGVADDARTDAVAAQDVAMSQQTASTAQNLRLTDPALAAQLAVVAYRTAPTPEARSALLEASRTPIPARYLGAGSVALAAAPRGDLVAVSDATGGTVTMFTQSKEGLTRVGGIPGAPSGVDRPASSNVKVYALTFLPDGDILAVADTAGVVTLWDVVNPHSPVRLAVLPGAPGPVDQLAVNAGGTELAAAAGNQVTRWALDDQRQLPSLPAPARVRTVAYSPVGGRLAFGTDESRVHVWSTGGTPAELTSLRTKARRSPAVSFSADGQLLAQALDDDVIRLWDVSTPFPRAGKALNELYEVPVTTTTFSPDGRYLIVGSREKTVYVLETRTWSVVRTLPHPDMVTAAAFTAGGKSVITAAGDGAIRWWNMRAVVPPSAQAPIVDMRSDAAGTKLAIFADGDLSVWDMTTRPSTLVRKESGTFSGAGDLSRDGRFLAAGTVNGDVLLYDLVDNRLTTLGGAGEKVEAVAFSADGTTLAAGGEDAAVRIWNLDLPTRPLATNFAAPKDIVLDLSWHPSADLLAVATANGQILLLDVTDPHGVREQARLAAPGTQAYSTTFSANGDLLATGGTGVVQLWDVRAPDRPAKIGSPLTGPTGRVLGLTFHPGRNLLAASAIDGKVWLWDIADPAAPVRVAVLADAGSPLNTAVFSPTGDALTAGGDDRLALTWHIDESAVVATVCASVGDPITSREWETHLPEVPYDPPC